MQTTHVAPPEPGTLVFSSDGEEIGEITEVQGDFFHVKKGMIFRKEVYLPLSSIVGTALGGDGIQVNLTRDEIESGDWSEPPATDAVADTASGEHNTMGSTTPYGETGASAPMAHSEPERPPAEGRADVGWRPDDTDATQQPETEAHYSSNDETTRP
jgi:hypothetical protein